MYRTTIRFHNRITRGEIPISYILINTLMGPRVYAEKELSAVFEVADPLIADGSIEADGSEVADGGGLGVLEKSARVLSFGSFERTISPRKSDMLTTFGGKQLQHVSIKLNNTDRYFSKLIAKEPFLSRELSWFLGFEDLPQSEHPELFKGIISEVRIGPSDISVEAEES